MGIGEVGMSLISESIIDDFQIWAKENEDKSIFPKIHKEERSYYTNRNPEEAYLVEYSFRDMAELKKILEEYSDLSVDSQILLKLIVGICKNRSSLDEGKNAYKDSLQSEGEISSQMLANPFDKVCENPLDKKVIEKFGAWAKENKDNNIFLQVSKQEDSYYVNRISEETYLMEYSFYNMTCLKELLGKYGGLSTDSQMLKNITVEICRDRCGNELKACENEINRKVRMESKTEQKDGKELPQYVYVF